MTIKAINVRNQFKGIIKEILEGEVVSEVDVQTASGIVTSVITTRSVRDLEFEGRQRGHRLRQIHRGLDRQALNLELNLSPTASTVFARCPSCKYRSRSLFCQHNRNNHRIIWFFHNNQSLI